jgi:2-dehydropantoate 2-reductase
MRFVVFGAGGIGGTVGARLAQHGHSVALIARGQHYEAIRDRGLRFESPDEILELKLPVVDHPAKIAWTPEDVVLLSVKTQHTPAALADLVPVAPPHVPIVCLQNGVANEAMALRHFACVYGAFVYCATTYLEPGIVQGWHAPTTGILDVGGYPSGIDSLAEEVSHGFRSATFFSESRANIMDWKYRKLLMNLGNAVEALCRPEAGRSSIVDEARREGAECLAASGIPFVSDEENARRRERLLPLRAIDGRERPGGSTWQSLARSTHSIETDYLNGEIVVLGRLHGVRAPINELLQRLSAQAAAEGTPPGSMTVEHLTSLMDRSRRSASPLR